MKEGFIIKPLNNKREVEYLRNIGLEHYVINGHGTYHNCLFVEHPKVFKALEEYRRKHIKFVKINQNA